MCAVSVVWERCEQWVCRHDGAREEDCKHHLAVTAIIFPIWLPTFWNLYQWLYKVQC